MAYIEFKSVDKEVVGIYGDILYVDKSIDTYGISYKDDWTVRRLLNGLHLKLNNRIEDIFNYIGLDKECLNTKICELSHTTFKYVMLAYLIINNKRFIIFDLFCPTNFEPAQGDTVTATSPPVMFFLFASSRNIS